MTRPEEIRAYDFTVQYRKGISSGNADAFSRLPGDVTNDRNEAKVLSTAETVSAADSSSHISALAGLQTEEDTSLKVRQSRSAALAVSATDSCSHSQSRSRDQDGTK